jgi:hypothetical protein
MKRWLGLFMAIVLSACASPATPSGPAGKVANTAVPTATAGRANYPDLGTAPELAGDTWLNTTVPLRLANLRGKVVLVEMWTFG